MHKFKILFITGTLFLLLGVFLSLLMMKSHLIAQNPLKQLKNLFLRKKPKRILPMQQILQNNRQYLEWKALMYIHLM